MSRALVGEENGIRSVREPHGNAIVAHVTVGHAESVGKTVADEVPHMVVFNVLRGNPHGLGNLLRQTEQLRELGARATKQVDPGLLETTEGESPSLTVLEGEEPRS